MKDERYKELMSQVGLPNSRSLLKALQQCAMEAVLEERSKHNLKALPKKWEPRGGNHHVVYFESRTYPTSFEAERAKSLHLKMDRLVNWLVEHCPDLSERDVLIGVSVTSDVTIRLSGTPGLDLKTKLDSGEVEL